MSGWMDKKVKRVDAGKEKGRERTDGEKGGGNYSTVNGFTKKVEHVAMVTHSSDH